MPFTPTYSYDPTSTDPVVGPVSAVRLRLGDTDFSQTATNPKSVVFADQEYIFFLNSNGGDSILALCDALLALANDKARLSAFVNLQGGGSVDLRQVAAELRAQEQEIRKRYQETPAEAYAESDTNDFTMRRLLYSQALRNP